MKAEGSDGAAMTKLSFPVRHDGPHRPPHLRSSQPCSSSLHPRPPWGLLGHPMGTSVVGAREAGLGTSAIMYTAFLGRLAGRWEPRAPLSPEDVQLN